MGQLSSINSMDSRVSLPCSNFRHNDFPGGLRLLLQNDLTGFNFDMNLSSIEPWASYSRDHTDLPRLRDGRVGGQVN